MKAEERDLILGLFDRVAATSTQENDREAEQLIREEIARNPNAAYVLVQSVLVQEEALRRADERIKQLENARVQAMAEPSSRSFLGAGPALDGGSVPTTGRRQRAEAPPSLAGTDDARRQNSGWSSGSFLSNALSTAGGVAGGMLLADSIRGLFGGSESGSLFGKPAEASTPTAENNNEPDNKVAAEDAAQDAAQDADYDSEYDWDDSDTFDI